MYGPVAVEHIIHIRGLHLPIVTDRSPWMFASMVSVATDHPSCRSTVTLRRFDLVLCFHDVTVTEIPSFHLFRTNILSLVLLVLGCSHDVTVIGILFLASVRSISNVLFPFPLLGTVSGAVLLALGAFLVCWLRLVLILFAEYHPFEQTSVAHNFPLPLRLLFSLPVIEPRDTCCVSDFVGTALHWQTSSPNVSHARYFHLGCIVSMDLLPRNSSFFPQSLPRYCLLPRIFA
jgi:hypothetical protein